MDVIAYLGGKLTRLPRVRAFVNAYGQPLFNCLLFADLTGFVAWRTYGKWVESGLGYVDVSFAVQNVIMLGLILLRRRHKAVDGDPFHQSVAMAAFFSGLLFMGQETTGGEMALHASNAVTFSANLMGIASLLNLGRNFGILIARRDIVTGGLYSVVRHPMYGSDILLRVGFLISHLNPFTVVVFIVSSGAYVYRAVLEERFLSRSPEYALYMDNVRYRFIPFVF